jgi:Txe/YoeB family toxin of Txe-Axe toxin-antitoxin module
MGVLNLAKESKIKDEIAEILKNILKDESFKIDDSPKKLEVGTEKSVRYLKDEISPTRGGNAFNVDILIFLKKTENRKNDDEIPFVVIEVKGSKKITTDEIIIYSGKAERHKRLYPWLRYGIIWNSTEEPNIPFRFFKNNENLDFAYNINEISKNKMNDRIKKFYSEILKDQVEIAIKLYEIFENESKDMEIYSSLIKIK